MIKPDMSESEMKQWLIDNPREFLDHYTDCYKSTHEKMTKILIERLERPATGI